MTSLCIYCSKPKEREEFSLEHILPRHLGGELCDDTFKTRRVCKRCNNLCGLFVDGAFLKNWFATNFRAEQSRSYVDLEKGSVLPLIYLGPLTANPLGTSDTIELWLGPSGDQIYHIHPPHDERFLTYAGGDPTSKDTGVAILFSRTTNRLWVRTALLSFAAHFRDARRVLANVVLQPAQDNIGSPPEAQDQTWIEALRSLQGKHVPLQVNVQLGFEQRFLAKVALGIGYNLLGERFLLSQHARLLQKALWERDYQVRSALPIPWTNLFQSNETLTRIIGWPGATTIVLFPSSPCLVLLLSFFNRTPLQVAISDDPTVWKMPQCLSIGDHGCVYVLIPQRRFFSGRIPIELYLSELHNALGDERRTQGIPAGVPILAQTRGWRADPKDLPPFEAPNSGTVT